VGVGGATLGGGVSYLSNKYGWACDNVASFELVIACGSLIIASPTSYSDLYWALRGGGNNFGIVTSFRLYAYPQGDMQFTQFEYNDTYFSRVISAFVNVGKNSADDPNAQQNLLFGHKNGTKIVRGQLAYQHPAESPRIFREYRRIPMFSKFPDIRIRQSDETALAGATAPKGFRQSFWVATCDLDLDFAIYATKLFYSKSKKFEAFPDVNANLNLQVITTRQISQMAKNGGNPLGLSYTKRPLLILLLFPQWSDQAYDNSIYRTNQEIFKHLKIEAKNRGLYNKFIYMNYASEYQDVIASYGKENKQKLKDIAKKYDPKEVFQKLQPGYFKLNGAPLQELP
jgi:hypothetical protein